MKYALLKRSTTNKACNHQASNPAIPKGTSAQVEAWLSGVALGTLIAYTQVTFCGSLRSKTLSVRMVASVGYAASHPCGAGDYTNRLALKDVWSPGRSSGFPCPPAGPHILTARRGDSPPPCVQESRGMTPPLTCNMAGSRPLRHADDNCKGFH